MRRMKSEKIIALVNEVGGVFVWRAETAEGVTTQDERWMER
jgi:hypothetical protein